MGPHRESIEERKRSALQRRQQIFQRYSYQKSSPQGKGEAPSSSSKPSKRSRNPSLISEGKGSINKRSSTNVLSAERCCNEESMELRPRTAHLQHAGAPMDERRSSPAEESHACVRQDAEADVHSCYLETRRHNSSPNLCCCAAVLRRVHDVIARHMTDGCCSQGIGATCPCIRADYVPPPRRSPPATHAVVPDVAVFSTLTPEELIERSLRRIRAAQHRAGRPWRPPRACLGDGAHSTKCLPSNSNLTGRVNEVIEPRVWMGSTGKRSASTGPSWGKLAPHPSTSLSASAREGLSASPSLSPPVIYPYDFSYS